MQGEARNRFFRGQQKTCTGKDAHKFLAKNQFQSLIPDLILG